MEVTFNDDQDGVSSWLAINIFKLQNGDLQVVYYDEVLDITQEWVVTPPQLLPVLMGLQDTRNQSMVSSVAPSPVTVSSVAPVTVSSVAPSPVSVSSVAPVTVSSGAPSPVTVSSAAPSPVAMSEGEEDEDGEFLYYMYIDGFRIPICK